MKAMVLFSGGVDSTTALALAVEKYGASEVLAPSSANAVGTMHTNVMATTANSEIAPLSSVAILVLLPMEGPSVVVIVVDMLS